MKFKRSSKLKHQLYVAWNLKMRFLKINLKNVLKILLNKVLSSFLAEVETERDSFRDEMLKLKTDLVTLGSVNRMNYRAIGNTTTRFPHTTTGQTWSWLILRSLCWTVTEHSIMAHNLWDNMFWITATRKEKTWNGTGDSKWNKLDWTRWATGWCSQNQLFEAI